MIAGEPQQSALLIEVPSSCGMFQPTNDWYTMFGIYDLRPRLVMFYQPAYPDDSYLGSANYDINNATVPAFWLARSDGAALVAALTAQLLAAAEADGAEVLLNLTGIVNVGLPMAEGVAMQPPLMGSRGPVSEQVMQANIILFGIQELHQCHQSHTLK
jgi:hypothetical protein